MRRILCLTTLLLAAATPLCAQGLRFGALGGIALGASTGTYDGVGVNSVSGWGAALTLAPDGLTDDLTARLDLGFAALGGQSFLLTWPESQDQYDFDTGVLGGSLNLVWNFLGSGRRATPYFIGGVGYYGVRVQTAGPMLPGAANTSTEGVVGYNAGLGLRESKFFVEARLTTLKNVSVPALGRTDLYNVPITVGLWF